MSLKEQHGTWGWGMHCDGSAKFLLHLGDSMDLATQEGKSGGDRKGKKPIIGARK
jgi:hypothetical protein